MTEKIGCVQHDCAECKARKAGQVTDIVKMPEPAIRLHGKKNGRLTADSRAYYDEAQMQKYGDDRVAAALEEAAYICDIRSNGENDASWCAERIRSLK